MQRKETKIERIEYKTIYVADDGTEFTAEAECKSYEETARCAINGAFQKLPIQINLDVGGAEPFGDIGCDDNIIAVKIRDANDVAVVNKWIATFDKCYHNAMIGANAIGTIQLFCTYDYDNGVWSLGTPDEFKKRYCDAIDSLYNEVIETKEN